MNKDRRDRRVEGMNKEKEGWRDKEGWMDGWRDRIR